MYSLPKAPKQTGKSRGAAANYLVKINIQIELCRFSNRLTIITFMGNHSIPCKHYGQSPLTTWPPVDIFTLLEGINQSGIDVWKRPSCEVRFLMIDSSFFNAKIFNLNSGRTWWMPTSRPDRIAGKINECPTRPHCPPGTLQLRDSANMPVRANSPYPSLSAQAAQ